MEIFKYERDIPEGLIAIYGWVVDEFEENEYWAWLAFQPGEAALWSGKRLGTDRQRASSFANFPRYKNRIDRDSGFGKVPTIHRVSDTPEPLQLVDEAVDNIGK